MESSDCGGYEVDMKKELGQRRSFDMQDVGQTSLVCTGKDQNNLLMKFYLVSTCYE